MKKKNEAAAEMARMRWEKSNKEKERQRLTEISRAFWKNRVKNRKVEDTKEEWPR